VIKTFRDKNTQKFFSGIQVPAFRPFYQQAVRRMQILDDATSLNDLRSLPSNHFKALSGNRKGQYSIRINRKWRICFEWSDGDALQVEIVEYHR
jgi:toxin HigB-1